MQPPILQIVALWEASCTVRIFHPDPVMALALRPDLWELSVSTDDTMETITVDASAVCCDVALVARTPHCLVCVSVRGRVPSTNTSSPYTTIKVGLLPPVVLSQGLVMPDRLQVLWRLPFLGSGTPAMGIDEVVTAIEVQHGDTHTMVLGPDSATTINGTIVLTLANIAENESYDLRMRCVGEGQKEGTWSEVITLYTLSPTMLQFSSVGEDYLSIVWGSNRTVPHWREWACVKDLQLRVWCPDRALRPRTYSHDTKEDTCIFPNNIVVNGLVPNTVYHVRVRWWNQCCGPVGHSQYFRVCTLAPIITRGMKKIGTEFVDIQFARAEGITLPSLHAVHDDDFENQNDKALTHRSTKPWRDVSDLEVMQIPLFYRIRMVRKKTANENDNTMIVDFDPVRDLTLTECLQTTRIGGLHPGASYSMTVRCLGVARRDFTSPLDSSHGLGKSHWGLWSDAVVVGTANRVALKVDQRGTKKIDLQWSRPKIVEQIGTCEVTSIRKAVVGIVACESETAFADEGDKAWAIDDDHLANAVVQRIEHADIFGQVSFDSLTPNTSYRISLTTLDDEGEWSGRHSVVVMTLREDVVSGRDAEDARSLPYVDEGYHLKEQDLPEWNDGVGTCRMLYQVAIGENRVKELRVLSAGRRSHVGLVAMALDLDEVGEDYAVMSWRVLDVVESAQPIGKQRPTSSLPIRSAAALPPTSGNKRAQSAQVLNREKIVTEYKLKVCLLEEWAKSSLLCEIYFRSASRSTRVHGLKVNLTYTVAICRFDAEVQQWVPSWSNLVVISPAKHLTLNVVGMSFRGVLLEWRRTRELRATTPIMSYKLTMVDVTHGNTSTDVVLESEGLGNCPSSHYLMTEGLSGPRLLRASVVPQYKNRSWGCYSNEVSILSVPVALALSTVSQSTAKVTWDSLEDHWLTPCDRKAVASRGMVFLSAKGGGQHHVDEVPWSQTSHVFHNLIERARYDVSAVAVCTVVKCACCPRPFHAAFVPTTLVVTDGQLALHVADVGEAYVSLKWPRGDDGAALFEVVLIDVDTSTRRTIVITPYGNTAGGSLQKIITNLCYGRSYTAYIRAETGTHSNVVAFRTRALLAMGLVSVDPKEGSFVVKWGIDGEEDGLGACQVIVTEVIRTPGHLPGEPRVYDVQGGTPWRLTVPGRLKAMYSVAARQAEIGASWGRWSRPILVCTK